MSKKKLLIINKSQFGYHSDTYYYCIHLKEEFEISYVCFDINLKKIDAEGINVIYLNNQGNYFKRGMRFIQSIKQLLQSQNFDIVFGIYFQGISLINTFCKAPIVFDVRTGAIGTTKLKRKLYNTLLKFESYFFKNISIISICLAKNLNLNQKKTHILPLGADSLSNNQKSFDKLKLLYVGTLHYRNIHESIIGIKTFLNISGGLDISYDIFGSGSSSDEQLLKAVISDNNLEDIVTFHGWKSHDELKYYFDSCNIGVSYIPINDYFDCQPPTKTYEYISSGMLCLATQTSANKALINNINGVLCNDSSHSFAQALTDIQTKRMTYSSSKIANSMKEYSWINIVQYNLLVYLENIIKTETCH